jgi:hypothetical protein
MRPNSDGMPCSCNPIWNGKAIIKKANQSGLNRDHRRQARLGDCGESFFASQHGLLCQQVTIS